jgi:hypothetical protein
VGGSRERLHWEGTPTVGVSGENVTKGYTGNSSMENEIAFYEDYTGKRE